MLWKIFLEFRENYNIKMLADNFAISKNKKSEFGRKIRDFGKHKKTFLYLIFCTYLILIDFDNGWFNQHNSLPGMIDY